MTEPAVAWMSVNDILTDIIQFEKEAFSKNVLFTIT